MAKNTEGSDFQFFFFEGGGGGSDFFFLGGGSDFLKFGRGGSDFFEKKGGGSVLRNYSYIKVVRTYFLWILNFGQVGSPSKAYSRLDFF